MIEVENYYGRQMRQKYKSKMRKTLALVLSTVFVQEILIVLNSNQEIENSYVRVAYFTWVFVTGISLYLGDKIYKNAVLILIMVKTTISLADLVTIGLIENHQNERFNLAFYLFIFHNMLDCLTLISVGIYSVTLLFVLHTLSFVSTILVITIYKLQSKGYISLATWMTAFYFFNLIDSLNHFVTELTLFFTYIEVERKGYYLNTFVDRLVPKHIKGVATNGAEKHENVTLLFADIVGFTEYSAGKNARQVVEMLSQLFTSFDKDCNSLNLYKMYTIGDCYVVMSFLDKNNRKAPKDEAADVLQLAIRLVDTIHAVRKKINFPKLNMRIGIHTGTVFGGVIGTHIVRFDLYGPDVLIANKMESGGSPGRINISESTKNLLDDLDKIHHTYEFNREIDIKPLNRKVKSYFLKQNSKLEEVEQL